MKKLLIIFSILLIFNTTVFGAYTLDTIYSSYNEENETVIPYLKPSLGFTPLEPEKIMLSKTSIYFHYNENESPVSLGGKVMPLNARQDKITYSSSDETVATVDENGNVTPKNKLGSAVITATNGKIKNECYVSVIIGVTGIEIKNAPDTLYADKPVAVQLKAEVFPQNAGLKDIIWESSDKSIATVDRTGTVMPSGVGEVTITATSKDKGISATHKINVEVFDTSERAVFTSKDITYSHYDISLYDAIDIQEQSSPTVFTADAYPATRDDIENNIIPSDFTDGYRKYQFLDLSKSNGVSIKVLDNYLEGKGVLEGKGAEFYNAARKYDISEVYLVVHACLESGNGTSQLATGVDYNNETVYNMFGIGAIDASPLEGGAYYAYSNGWTSVNDAIWGGAEWISRYYINNSDYRQNTLYKMRWNPESPGVHQYATDVEWATKQAKTLNNMFAAFPSAYISFDYPVYAGESEVILSAD